MVFLLIFAAAAAQQRLAPGSVPAPVARGQIAPLGRLAGTNELHLAIALPLRNAGALTNLLREIYNPSSPQFHRYLTPAAFTARFGPTPTDYAAVVHFARTNGFTVTATHADRLLVDVTGKTADVERAFHVRLDTFRHPREPRNFFAPDREPAVDAALPIFFVSGLNNYSRPRPRVVSRPTSPAAKVAPRGGSGPKGGYVGNDFRTAYVPGTPLTGAGQSVALLQFDGFYAADITNYLNLIGLTSNVPQIVVVPVDGGVATPGSGDIEVSLDIEMVLSMSPGVSNIYVYEAPNASPWVDLLSQIADDNLAKQVSCSWGGGGPDPASEQLFLRLAAQGQSFFNASGDADAFAGVVDFPSDSPNITQVGGTTLTTDGSGNYLSETVWNWGYVASALGYVGSGGGISPSVAIPPWQLGISMTTNDGSLLMRNVPDVALTADNVYVAYGNGTNAMVGGTSCAAPLWAGFTALVNQQAAQAAQPPVGFLNPAFYGLCRGTNYAATFHDITAGDNTSASSPTNFYAVPGYDLCTGWGTPNGTNLINALTTPDNLRLLPQAVVRAGGQVGGPFTQTNWTLVLLNVGPTSLAWSVGGEPAWLSVSPHGGTLPGLGSTLINLKLTGAETLPTGSYLAVLTATNLSLSRMQSVALQLDLGQSLVQNGGFETGDFTDWTLVGDTVGGGLIYNTVATDSEYVGITDVVHSGTYGAFLGEGGYLATLTQTLPTTAGQWYQLSFWLDNPAAGSGQEFVARWNGADLMDLPNPPAFGWTNFQFLVTAAGTNTDLQFAAENDPNYFGFDDVSVTPVPPVNFESAGVSGGNLQLNWDSLAGLNYEIQYSTNLAPANWQPLGAVTAATNVCSFADTNRLNGDPQRFYRLRLVLP